MNEGRAGIQRWSAEADRLGVSLSENTVQSMEQMHGALTSMNAAFQGAGVQVFLEFHSAIQGVVQVITDLVASFTDAMRQGGMLKDVMDLLGVAAKLVAAAFAVVIAVVKAVWSAATDSADSVGLVFMHLADMIREIFSGLASGISGFFSGLVDAAKEAGELIGQIFANLGTVISDAMHGNLSGASEAFAQLKSDAASAGSSIGASLKGSISSFNFSDVKANGDGFFSDIKARQQGFAGEIQGNWTTLTGELATMFGNADSKIALSMRRRGSIWLRPTKAVLTTRLRLQ